MSFRPFVRSALAGLALCSGLTVGRAAPSSEDQEACTPDVFRLCTSEIPDEAAIVSCLNAKVAQLSPACRAVIDPPRTKPKRRARHAA